MIRDHVPGMPVLALFFDGINPWEPLILRIRLMDQYPSRHEKFLCVHVLCVTVLHRRTITALDTPLLSRLYGFMVSLFTGNAFPRQ
jgi:hypothetical protein